MTSRLAILFTGALCLGAVYAESLDDVLARMDKAASGFQSYSASVKRVEYTKLFDSTEETGTGTMRLKRAKNGILGIVDLTSGKDHTLIHLNGTEAENYLPKAKMVQIWNLKKFMSGIEGMLLLGFAIPSADIKRDYDVTYVGEETLDGVKLSHIALVPKSAEALKYVRKIDLWVNAQGNAARQKETEPSGNYRLVINSDIHVNPDLPDSAFELATPKDVKRVKEN